MVLPSSGLEIGHSHAISRMGTLEMSKYLEISVPLSANKLLGVLIMFGKINEMLL